MGKFLRKEMLMQLRHEVKCEISRADALVLENRLRVLMKCDGHAEGGAYKIRSLYFDTPGDKALADKTNGAYYREKYRIRVYNSDSSFIRLERKVKIDSLGYKESAELTEDECRAVIRGDVEWMKNSGNEVVRAFYTKIKNELLSPKVIVDYTRRPFVFPAGNVRVTIDSDVRTALKNTDMLDFDCVTVPVKDARNILEVKWDNFLPDIIRQAIALDSRQNGAYSKYASSRMYE